MFFTLIFLLGKASDCGYMKHNTTPDIRYMIMWDTCSTQRKCLAESGLLFFLSISD